MQRFKGRFDPTDRFQRVLSLVELEGLPAPAAAAGIMAAFTDGAHFEALMDCLVDDGITEDGLIDLAQAALAKLAEVRR